MINQVFRSSRWTFGLFLLAGLLISCGGSTWSGKSAGGTTVDPQSRRGETSATGAGETTGVPNAEAPELWLFGTVTNPRLAQAVSASGVRAIVNLRGLKMDFAKERLADFAKRDLGLAICLRWMKAVPGGGRPKGRDNHDTPPTPQERERAIAQLTQLLGSRSARSMKDRLYIQFYNEVGGGPGRFPPEHADELLDFATAAASEIRKVNPDVQICGPAVTGGQLSKIDMRLTKPSMVEKADVVKKALRWTAEHADASDIHVHGVDGSRFDASVANLRRYLDQYGGEEVHLVSFEWSCARFPRRDDKQAVAGAIHGVWDMLARHNLQVATYGPYWPLEAKSEAASDRFGWASVVDSNGDPNPPVYETLREIGRTKANRGQ